MKAIVKKYWSDILFLVVVVLLVVPQTRMPILVFVQRVSSFSPAVIDKDDRVHMSDYDWNLRSLNGETVNFSNSKGKVVIVNFWATWCPPCVAEMPSMQSLYDKYNSTVDFYFVTNDDPQRVVRFLDDNDYDLPVFFESGPASEVLIARSLPTTFLISKQGEIMIRKTGAANWDSEIVNSLIRNLQE